MKKNLSPSTSILNLCLIVAIAAAVFGVSTFRSRAAGFFSMIQKGGTAPQTKGSSSRDNTSLNSNAPLVGPVTVTATAGTLGPTDYATLKLAFDAINLGTHQGAITIDINGNTTETASAVLNNSGAGSASYASVSITPSGGARTISGNIVGAIIKLNGADNVTIDGRIGGTGRNLTVSNSSTTTATAAIWLASVVAGNGASSNIIRNLEIACGVTNNNTNSTFGIIMCGATIGTTINGDDNDNNQFIFNRIIRARYGVVTRGVTTNLNIAPIVTDNIIGPASFGADEIGKTGILMQADTGAIVSRNTIQFVGGDLANTTAGADRMGIALGSEAWSATASTTLTSNTYTVTKNIIHDVVEERTFSAVGIELATTGGGSATNNLIANNFIYNVRADGTSGDQVCGIGIVGGHTDRVVFNSISLTGDMDPGASTSSSTYGNAIRIPNLNGATHANLTLAENSIYLDVNSNTAANHYYAITNNAAAYSFGTGFENYNNLYINAGNAQLRTGGLGTAAGNAETTEFATLVNWQAAYTVTQDANSIQADPLYFSTTSDLHIPSGSPNVNTGLTIAGVADDIDAQVRPNGANPEIGADEFYALPGTLQFSSASYSGSEGNMVTVTVSRVSGSSGTVGVTVTLNDGAAIGGGACGAGVDFVNPGPQILSFGDAVTSQSINVQLCSDVVFDPGETFTATLSSATGGASLGSPTTATVTITDIAPPFTGSVNVGAGQNYTSLTNPGGIFEALNNSGAAGNVTINITSDLTGETGAVALNEVAGGFTVTIKPSGAARAISGTSTPAGLIKLNGADGVTIDGSLSGGADRSLTITNNNAAGVVIWIATNATSGANDNTIKNCNLFGSATPFTTIAGVLAGSGTTLGGAAEFQQNNNSIRNNLINKVQNCAFLSGNAAGLDQNWVVSDNTFGSAVVADKMSFRGMLIGGAQNMTVSNNSISGISSSTVTSSTMSGIQVSANISGGIISRNQIKDIRQNNTTGWGSNGIYLTAATTASSLTIANNFISDVASQGFNGVLSTDNGYGIMIDTGAGYNIYDNTVNLNTNQVSASGITAAINIAAAVTTVGGIDLRDNILADTQTTGTRYGAYDSSTAGATIFSSINYNDYFAQNVGFLTSARATLANWQTATGQDANSKAVDPVFVSATDLHLQASSTLISMGIAIAAVNDDVDTDLRDDTPDIGADETVMGRTGTIPAGTYRDANIGTATLGGNVTITGTLTLSGILTTGANTLTIGCNGSISGAGASNFVIGNLKKVFCGAGMFNFAVGTLSTPGPAKPLGTVTNEYSPVLANVTAGTFPADFTVKAVKGTQPNVNAGTSAQRYWALTATGVTADLTFNYLQVDVMGIEANYRIIRVSGGSPVSFPNNCPSPCVNPGANTAFISAVSQFSDWTVGEGDAPTDVAFSSFTADGYAAAPGSPNGGVQLNWQTGLEVANLGFNIYRDQAGQRVRVNPDMIAGSAFFVGARTVLGAGRSYVWRDAQNSGGGGDYWLEAVDINGFSAWYGPVRSSGVKKLTSSFEPESKLLRDLGEDQTDATTPVETKPKRARMNAEQLAVQAVMAAQNAVKIGVRREGWYQISQTELAAAGLDPRVDPQLLQLVVDGQEQPMNVVTGKDGRVSAIEFYGLGADSPYTSVRTYWLSAGAQPGKRIEQVKSAGGAPAGGSFAYTVERRDRTIYFPALRNGEKENFFGAVIARDAVDQTLNVQRLESGAATLEVALQGVTMIGHSIDVELNGARVGSVLFNGQAGSVGRFTLQSSMLKEGQNVVRLTSRGGQGDVSLVDYIRLTYAHRYTAEGDALRFTAAGRQQVTVDGFSNSAIRVLDVTNPNSVQELIGAVQPQKSGYAVALNLQSTGQRTLLAVGGEMAKPAGIAANVPSSWRQPGNGADLIIVTRRDFFVALDTLRVQRQKQGYSVALVDIEDVYDEFSYGQKTPQAVKDFCAYAAGNWKKAPRFVLLAGDASFDPKNYLGFGDSDVAPTRLVDTELMETASDDWFVDFNGDGLPEMAIGRLPVRTAEEATRLVAKIVGYDGQRSAGSVLLASDHNDTYDFGGASNQLRGLIPGSIRVETVDRAHLDDATARAMLIDGINRGQIIVNYTGHGSVNQWRGNILTNGDAEGLTNKSGLSLFVTMTCLNGYFQDVALDSLAESLLKAQGGGAVAVWGSSGMTTPDIQSTLNQEAYRLIFGGTPMTIGEATARAKAAVNNGDVRRTWILLGDPTTRLAR